MVEKSFQSQFGGLNGNNLTISDLETVQDIKKFKYQLVSIGIMNTQINVRLPEKMLVSVQSYVDKHGFNSIQDFIKELIREKLYDESSISKEELILVKKLIAVSEDKKLYGTEKELFNKLRR